LLNGRVYDPNLGRFMEADPIVQAPMNLQSLNRYSYVMNNPLTLVDPSGFNWVEKRWKGAKKHLKTLSHSPRQFVRNIYQAKLQEQRRFLGRDDAQLLGSLATFACGPYQPACAAGFSAAVADAHGASPGQAALAGAMVGATAYVAQAAGGNNLNEMVGGGINGYLQTGDMDGFARGFATGAIPYNLGIDAYNTNAALNVVISVARDGIRGAAVGGKDGILSGIAYGQLNNALGHLVGAATGKYQGFRDGAFFYEGSWWDSRGALALGNVISGSQGVMSPWRVGFSPERYASAIGVHNHEMGHLPQGVTLGALYIPTHLSFMGAARVINKNTHGPVNLLENGWHPYPHSQIP